MNSKGLDTVFYFSPAILSNSVMVGDTLHLPCRVGGLRSLENKVNPRGQYSIRYFSPAILSNDTVILGDTVHLPCQEAVWAALEAR
jgi:hypothetical protein